MKGVSDVLLSLLSFQGPHTGGNLESRNKIRRFSNKRTGSRVHAWDDNYNNRSRIKTLRDDGLTTSDRTAKTFHTASEGFTLIELLVVVLIIGILASVAWPNYQMAVERSRAASALAYGRAFRDSVDRYYMAHTRMPTSAEALDIGLKNCPQNFACDFQYITTGRLYIVRQNGPFWYQLVVRANASDWTTMQGTIYCAAPKNSPKGVQFCQTWGELIPHNDDWERAKIE